MSRAATDWVHPERLARASGFADLNQQSTRATITRTASLEGIMEGEKEKKPKPGVLRVDPKTKYQDAAMKTQQKIVGWVLSMGLLALVVATFALFRVPDKWWSQITLAALGGLIGGLLHSLKWFYRTIASGEWLWDKLWWRFLNPLVSGVMGFSIFIVFRSGIEKAPQTEPGKEAFIAYSVGFLTGLFADNAMNKLRDIAYVLFGTTKESDSKPKASEENEEGGEGGGGNTSKENKPA